jgi:hypothetical protein
MHGGRDSCMYVWVIAFSAAKTLESEVSAGGEWRSEF